MIGAFSGTTATFFFQKTSSDLATYDVTWVARSSSKTWTDKSPSFNSFFTSSATSASPTYTETYSSYVGFLNVAGFHESTKESYSRFFDGSNGTLGNCDFHGTIAAGFGEDDVYTYTTFNSSSSSYTTEDGTDTITETSTWNISYTASDTTASPTSTYETTQGTAFQKIPSFLGISGTLNYWWASSA